ncbi:MAG: helix-turn-helix domain-containing protein [Anaerolineae bacterium]
MMKNEMLTPDEVADYLKVPIQTIWRWCRKGTLPAVKIGKYWRVPREELDDFIEARGNWPLREREEVRG